MKLIRPVELLSAYTCMIPFSLTYFFDQKSFVNLALLLHMPPRVLYHLHRSFSNDRLVSEELYKYYLVCLFTSIMLIRYECCLLYTSPSPRDLSTSRMPSSA